MFKRLIKAIEFSISSDQDVLNQSVVEVLHGKIPWGQKELCNILYDLRMGTIKKSVKCEFLLWIIPNARATFVTLRWPCLLSIPFAKSNSNR